MASEATSAEARELSLVSKVEFRIALADSDEQLQLLLRTYLAPLLLKLGSEHISVRNKVIALCRHICTRIQPLTFDLPLLALLKQFKETQSPLVRHFDLIYIKLALEHVSPAQRAEHFPHLVLGVSRFGPNTDDAASIFNLILRSLVALKSPYGGEQEGVSFRDQLGISNEDALYLSKWISKLLMLIPVGSPRTSCPGLSKAEFNFLVNGSEFHEVWNSISPAGLSLNDTKIAAIKFLASGAFTDRERYIPAVIASASSNESISTLGMDLLKRTTSFLEDSDIVSELFDIFSGVDTELPASPAIRTKVLSLLSKSVKATADINRMNFCLDSHDIFETNLFVKGLEGNKLRNQLLQFCMWFARMSPSVSTVAPRMVDKIQEFIQTCGWPSQVERSNAFRQTSRNLAYDTIGVLASKLDHSSEEGGKRLEMLIRWFFVAFSSDVSNGEVFTSIDQAFGSLTNSVARKPNIYTLDRLRECLMHYMNIIPDEIDPKSSFKVSRSPKSAVLRFVNTCLPFRDVDARWINIMALAANPTQDLGIIEEGRKGLDPYLYRILNPPGTLDSSAPAPFNADFFYRLPNISDLVESVLLRNGDGAGVPRVLIYSTLYSNAYAPAMAFLRNVLLCEALSESGVPFNVENPNWEERLDVIISTCEVAREAVRSFLKICPPLTIQLMLSGFLKGASSSSDTPLGRTAEYFVEISSLLSTDTLNSFRESYMFSAYSVESIRPSAHAAIARSIGITASLDTNFETQERLCSQALDRLSDGLTQRVKHAETVRGDFLTLMYVFTRLSFRGHHEALPITQVKNFYILLLDILQQSKDVDLREAVIVSVGELSLASLLSADLLPENGFREMLGTVLDDAKKGKESAIIALGRLSLAFREEKELFDRLLSSLYSFHELRGIEIQLSIGEALSVVAVGWASKSLLTIFDVDSERPQSHIPSHVLSDMLVNILRDCKSPKPSLKRASVVWLLSLVQYCGHCQQVQDQLRQCQAAFVWLLADRDEIVQETASRGLSLVFEKGGRELKDDLVRDLIQSFTAESSNLGGGRVSIDTQLFEPGALPTGDGSITTYKDIVGLATEVGDPSLVYRFMSLASNNSVWSSRAAFGRFGLGDILGDSGIDGYLSKNPKFFPKLYRYRFDPNPNVQKSMNDIWNTLVKDSNAVINSHFDAIMEDLLKSILAGKEWRVRQASCAAIADLIQGRPVQQYEKFLSDILTNAFKVLDDIKASVREAAFNLCQTLSNTLIRSFDEGIARSEKTQLMLQRFIPFLLHYGMESNVPEIQIYSITTMTTLVRKSPTNALGPYIPDILEKFLLSLSSVEPEMMNYIYLNADKYGVSGQDIDKARLNAVNNSPIMQSIELYLLDMLDSASMKEVVLKLENVLRSAIGLPTKAAWCRALVRLSSKPILFQPYADRFIQLTKTHILGRNHTLSVAFSTAIGHMMRCASDEQMLKIMEYAQKIYFDSESTLERVAAGELSCSLSKHANERVNRVLVCFVPFVFVGKHDTDEEVRKAFQNALENTINEPQAASQHLQEVLDLAHSGLDSPRWAIKHASALAIAKVVQVLSARLSTAATMRAVWPGLERALGGKTWAGKEHVIQAMGEFATRASLPLVEARDIKSQMIGIAIREAKRNSEAYRPHALKCLGILGKEFGGTELAGEAITIIRQMLKAHDTADPPLASKGSMSQGDAFAAGIECMLKCLDPCAPTAALSEQTNECIGLIEAAVGRGGRRARLALYDGLQGFFDRADGQSVAALANRLLFRDADGLVEAARIKRAQAAGSLTAACASGRVSVEAGWRDAVHRWGAEERSQAVKELLVAAADRLAGLEDGRN
ncbi:proteasome component M29 [Ophidiomyces ophidiicola]|uniref:Proteasome component M29 n=1 Tax=Ophidiomyces ophidiicola TaxID=1387563 RepID=A0ACB8UU02_9EURO|nr:proteasome component M29 [Ophidiomyces ophidiicola]KAI1906494.1 proteasome component M29 [Ophidiomyces ophidiicola]KAI1920592.1 proteasome component M29 [Ophidiomyces ophidiicola]KAI1999774.1 proteasome component M29 [Ophidiomyces ophidiicola]KAI2001593.1 proteasome component M29 [Ophidiomyces ophidiicola]